MLILVDTSPSFNSWLIQTSWLNLQSFPLSTITVFPYRGNQGLAFTLWEGALCCQSCSRTVAKSPYVSVILPFSPTVCIFNLTFSMQISIYDYLQRKRRELFLMEVEGGESGFMIHAIDSFCFFIPILLILLSIISFCINRTFWKNSIFTIKNSVLGIRQRKTQNLKVYCNSSKITGHLFVIEQ